MLMLDDGQSASSVSESTYSWSAFARALRRAVEPDERLGDNFASTKGVL